MSNTHRQSIVDDIVLNLDDDNRFTMMEIATDCTTIADNIKNQKDNDLIDIYAITGAMADMQQQVEDIATNAVYAPSLPVQHIISQVRNAIDNCNDVLIAEMQRRAESMSVSNTQG